MSTPSTMDTQHVQIGDGRDLFVQNATTAKIGFYGVTPVVQTSAITSPGSTASTASSPTGYGTTTQADAIVTAVRALCAAMKSLGLTA